MTYNLAQLNLAEMSVPLDHPSMADFVNNLDRINQIADGSEGFVWRYIEDGEAEEPQVFDSSTFLVNMSVWTSLEALFNFTYRSEHVEIFKRRKEWFKSMKGMHMVCWYIADGHIPSLGEAKERLEYLQQNGQTPYAFTFKAGYTVADFLSFAEKNGLKK